MKISREGLIIIFFGTLASIAFIRSWIALTLLTGLIFLSIPLISLIWTLLAIKSIEIRRELPEEGVAGEQLFTTYSVITNSIFPAFGVKLIDSATRGFVSGLNPSAASGVTIRQSYSPLGSFFKFFGIVLLEEVDLFEEAFHKTGLRADFPLGFPPMLKGNWYNRDLPLVFPVRGKYRVGPCEITAGDPLGIFRISAKVTGFTETLILPTWTSLRYFPMGGSSSILRDENIPRDREGVSPEFLGVREYQQGDPLKSVHWKLTAKHNQIMVKQYVQQVESSWGIIMDLRKGYNAGTDRETSLEYMIEIAASILEQFDDERIPHVLALAADDITTSENLRGEKSFDEELRLLAASRNDGSFNLYERAVALTEKYPQISWLVITSRKDEDIINTAEVLGRFGGNVMIVQVNFNSFLTEDFPPEMITKWRRMWGAEVDSFDESCMAVGAKLFQVSKGDDLGLVFYG